MKLHDTAFASFTSSWLMLMIWSSAHPPRGARGTSCVTPSVTLEPTDSRFAESRNPQPNCKETRLTGLASGKIESQYRSFSQSCQMAILHRTTTKHSVVAAHLLRL